MDNLWITYLHKLIHNLSSDLSSKKSDLSMVLIWVKVKIDFSRFINLLHSLYLLIFKYIWLFLR